jgi:UDP:flavonoid glycosyltransferase YjiC (YdhE family)
VREAIARRDGAQRLAEAFRRAGGPAAAADALERATDRQPSAAL